MRHSLLAYRVSAEKSADNVMEISFYVICCFSLVAFNIFSLSFFFKCFDWHLKIFIHLFIYFLAALGLCCCVWAFSSCSEQRLLFVVVCGFLIAVASLVVEHGL